MYYPPATYALLDRWIGHDGYVQVMRIVDSGEPNISVMGTYSDYARLIKRMSIQTVVIYGSSNKKNKEGYTIDQAVIAAEAIISTILLDGANKRGRKFNPSINIVDPYDGTLHATLGKGE